MLTGSPLDIFRQTPDYYQSSLIRHVRRAVLKTEFTMINTPTVSGIRIDCRTCCLFFAVIVWLITGPAHSSHAEEITSFTISGTFDSKTKITLPPPSPTSFSDLADSSFYSFSSAIGFSKADKREVAISFYFWRLSSDAVTVRAYVDGEYVGGMPGVPSLVGRARINFNKNGTKSSTLVVPDQSSIAALLDRDPISTFSELDISISWATKPPQRVFVNFAPIAMTDSPSVIKSAFQGSVTTID